MAAYNSFITKHYDIDFKDLKNKKFLSFFPWVGVRYLENRVVVVGKWHFGNDNASHEEYTRERVADNGIQKNDENPYKRATKLLLGRDLSTIADREALWSQLAFFNLKKGQYPENDVKNHLLVEDDFYTFVEIAKIMLPRFLLFVDVELENYGSKDFLEKSGVSVTPINSFDEKGTNIKVEMALLSTRTWSAISVFTKLCNQPFVGNIDSVERYMPKFF